MKNKNQILEKRSLLSVLLFLFLLNYTTHGQTNWPCGVDVHGIDHFHMDCPDEGIIITSLEVDGAEGSEVQGIITSGQSIYILPGYSQVRIVPFTERLKGELSHVTTIGGTGNGGGFNQPSSQTRVDLYPNPTQSDISITVDGKQKIISYTLLGMYETSIKNKRFILPISNHTFSIETLKKGIYILKIHLENKEVITKKIIKN